MFDAKITGDDSDLRSWTRSSTICSVAKMSSSWLVLKEAVALCIRKILLHTVLLNITEYLTTHASHRTII